MSLKTKVATNTLAQIAGKSITSFLALLTTRLVTSFLGKEGFGDYTYLVTLLILFGALADWGTTTIGVRETAKTVAHRQGLVLTNLWLLKSLFALGAMILMFLFAWLVPWQSSQSLLLRPFLGLACLFLLFSAWRSVARVVFQTRLAMSANAWVEVATSALLFLGSWWVIRQGLGLLPLLAVYVVATALGVLLAFKMALTKIKLVFQFNLAFWRRLWQEALPMGAILLMFTMDNRIDTLMLAVFKNSGEVGIYGLASRVYDLLILGAAFLMNTLLPVMAGLKQKSQWQRLYQQAFDVLLLVGGGVVLFLWPAAPLMVRLLAGAKWWEFKPAVSLLRFMSLPLLLTYFNHLTGYTLVALGKQRPYFWVALGSLLFNFLVNLILIPRYSYFGAVGVTLMTEALVLVTTTVFIFRFLKFLPSLTSFGQTAKNLVLDSKRFFKED